MEIEIKVKKKVDIKILKVDIAPRYWEDTTVNGEEDTEGKLVPFRKGDLWKVDIDIDNGTVLNWPKGTKVETHYKVCDAGIYTAIDSEGNEVYKHDGYVPSILPGKHYGDYVILNIDEEGKITNWDKVTPNTLEDFCSEE